MLHISKCAVAARAFFAYTEGSLNTTSAKGRERAVMSLASFLSTVPYSDIYDTAVELVLWHGSDMTGYTGAYAERCCKDTASTFVAVFAMAAVCQATRKQLGLQLLEPLGLEWQALFLRAVGE